MGLAGRRGFAVVAGGEVGVGVKVKCGGGVGATALGGAAST